MNATNAAANHQISGPMYGINSVIPAIAASAHF